MSKAVWPEEYEGVQEGECESCGDETLVKQCDDPYSWEINEEVIDMGFVCRECYCNRAEDI